MASILHLIWVVPGILQLVAYVYCNMLGGPFALEETDDTGIVVSCTVAITVYSKLWTTIYKLAMESNDNELNPTWIVSNINYEKIIITLDWKKQGIWTHDAK